MTHVPYIIRVGLSFSVSNKQGIIRKRGARGRGHALACTLVGAWPWSSPEAKPSSLSLGQILRHKIRKLSGPSLSTRGGPIATHSFTYVSYYMGLNPTRPYCDHHKLKPSCLFYGTNFI